MRHSYTLQVEFSIRCTQRDYMRKTINTSKTIPLRPKTKAASGTDYTLRYYVAVSVANKKAIVRTLHGIHRNECTPSE